MPNRRGFLQRLGAIVTAAVVAPLASGAARIREGRRARKLYYRHMPGGYYKPGESFSIGKVQTIEIEED